MTNEQLALEFAEIKKNLKAKLEATKALLKPEHRKGFGRGKIDYKNKRMIGKNGIVLQWKVRLYPQYEENPRNPQSPDGVVVLQKYNKTEVPQMLQLAVAK